MGNACIGKSKSKTPEKKDHVHFNANSQQPQDVTIVNHSAATSKNNYNSHIPNHYIALYDFTTAVDSLAFSKGDEFQVLEFTTQDWYKVRRLKDDVEGYAPAQYIAKHGSLQAYPWYFEELSRKESGVMLTRGPDGCFLVRPSGTRPGCYSLSVKVPDSFNQSDDKASNIKHYIIRYSKENDTYFIKQQMPFNSIANLLEYFKSNPEHLGFRLTEPAQPLSENPDLVLKTWEVAASDVALEEKLGEGVFGTVYKGLLRGRTQVAVKTFKPGSMDPEAFLQEADLMKKLKHKNILSLLAIQTKTEPIMIVTELMSNGALLDFLRKPKTKQELKFKDQIDIASQCADGMHYLESTGFIHRDLAARNVLVNASKQCKIADFGLSKLDEEYEATNTTRFPVKWTAPEAALFGTYSIKSDVWSYGVLLYEIVTFGRIPYPGKNNREVMEMLESEARMDKPQGCPDTYFQIMMSCHKQNPEERPTFETLKFQLDEYFFGTTDREYQCE